MAAAAAAFSWSDCRDLARQWLQQAVHNDTTDLRPGQWEAIDTVVNQRQRLLVVQRTGWGKSVVYFLAARLLRMRQEGMTLIVSPLISLMRNQQEQAERLGVRAWQIHSSNSDEWDSVYQAVSEGNVDAILISPERLADERFIQNVLLSDDPTRNAVSRIGLLVVDEAHCISVWGHDFRPDYRRLIDVIRLHSGGENLRVLGTTATATARVVEDIRQYLGTDVVVQRGSLDRESLFLQNIFIPDQPSRMAWLADNVPKLPRSGVIYVLRKVDADQVTDWLQHCNIKARAYYAGIRPTGKIPDEEQYLDDIDGYRKYLENLLIDNEIKVLVATIALGMGFDKPDIGFVVHFQMPGSIVGYYQMVGRAGRDNQPAHCILLSGDEDASVHEHFWKTAFPEKKDMDDILKALNRFRDFGLTEGDLEEHVNIRPRHIVQAVRHMASRDPNPPIVRTIDGKRWTVSGDFRNFQLDMDMVNEVTEQRRKEWNDIHSYFETKDRCLMTTMRQMLDDNHVTDPSKERCGRCFNCTGKSIVSTDSNQRLADKAIEYIRQCDKSFVCKTEAPRHFIFSHSDIMLETYEEDDDSDEELPPLPSIDARLRAEPGRVLCFWMDIGWGMKVFEDKKNGYLSDELVNALADMIQNRWKPWVFKRNFGWVTCVPSIRHGKLVPDFAYRLSQRLGLMFKKVIIHKNQPHDPQKSRKNNYHRCLNLDGTFMVKDQLVDHLPRGPVLLVDDIIRSTWTLTVIAAMLRQAGSGPVYPVGLARIETED